MGAFFTPAGAAIGAGIGVVGGALEGAAKYSELKKDANSGGMNVFNY
jgi:hypothetical protein